MNRFDSHSWFLDAIRYFRGFGFFVSHRCADEGVGEVIKLHWHGDWDEYLAAVSDHPGADQLLLVADTQRVWSVHQ